MEILERNIFFFSLIFQCKLPFSDKCEIKKKKFQFRNIHELINKPHRFVYEMKISGKDKKNGLLQSNVSKSLVIFYFLKKTDHNISLKFSRNIFE